MRFELFNDDDEELRGKECARADENAQTRFKPEPWL
jgi:hypothetical protein